MSWRDQLRRLDADLAGGRISRHEHRRRRAELLTAAARRQTPPPAEPGPTNWQTTNPGCSEQRPPRAQEPPENSSAALLRSERPTTAPSPADERPTDSMRYPSLADAPTVITRAVNPPSLMPAAPWLPAPRVADTSGKPGVRRHTRLFLVVAVLVVLGMIVGTTWFLSVPTTNTAPAGPANPELVVAGKLPPLPGTANPDNATISLDKAVRLKVVSATDASKIRASGAQEVVYRASADTVGGNMGYQLVAIPTSSASDAAKLVKGLRQTLTDIGFTAAPLGPSEAETAYTTDNPGGRMSGLWYASESVVIGLAVSQPVSEDAATLRARLAQVLQAVAAALPPNP
ncbi:MAG TPA: hypothetical protein VJT49_16575 [Amycolatopsis sp.]|uniref:hypothetical protein n=1 Tax=Amycolatopsis sp. TaxID=37632 RepID=UPI002B4771B9|nr:hypothetical protein [Amycolatopsis sp.]HKS46690.1 hypothetical protein [Amycolatopsis sp.]